MKKRVLCLCAAIAFVSLPLRALDFDQGLSISGGVKTGVLLKKSDFSGKLDDHKTTDPGTGEVHEDEYPFTLYFASRESEAYNGEGWLSFNYTGEIDWASWGVNLGAWAHGDLKGANNTFYLGDHNLWANFFDDQFQIKAGEGGGTPIGSGGWLGTDWLGYRGIRLFWVSSFGLDLGINFVDPGLEGFRPAVDYLAQIMLGAQYRIGDFKVALIWDNNPIYDDSETDLNGGRHRDPDARPVGEAGNLGFGVSYNNIYGGKGNLALDGTVVNLGGTNIPTKGTGSYTYSPIEMTFALKTGYPFLDDALNAEFKTRYNMRQGDNADDTAAAIWGKLEFEPYVSYTLFGFLKFELALNTASYFNSYYLSASVTPFAIRSLEEGQIAKYPWAAPYGSRYQITLKPAVVLTVGGGEIHLGYERNFSKYHTENIIYLDFRWAF
ncbi:hypothetical protein AGMMS50267_15130 [Spirochaetia bacterium]|nr:hypothetical protein AGMMS50267_15130 [Spirochaetia bacterium]